MSTIQRHRLCPNAPTRLLFAVLLSAALVFIAAGALATVQLQHAWLDPNGEPLPFTVEEEVLEFLATAEVVETVDELRGVTRPRKMLLDNGVLRMHAVFRDLDERRDRRRFRGRTHPVFRDSYQFEVAAYELSRMLGFDAVPPTVLRRVHGTSGSLQAFVEGAFRETDRRDRGLQPPDPVRWNRQWQQMELFDQLVYNLDRNSGNLLIDGDWKIWLIDHTIAFFRYTELEDTTEIVSCERRVWERLRALDRDVMRDRLRPFLLDVEIDGLLARADLIVERLAALIAARGEAAVIWDRDAWADSAQ